MSEVEGGDTAGVAVELMEVFCEQSNCCCLVSECNAHVLAAFECLLLHYDVLLFLLVLCLCSNCVVRCIIFLFVLMGAKC